MTSEFKKQISKGGDEYNIAPKELKNLNQLDNPQDGHIDEEDTYEAKASNLVSSI